MLEIIVTAFVIGIAFNASPGPVMAQTLAVGMRGGFWPGFRVQLGSLLGDAVWAIIALSGMAWLMQVPYMVAPMLFSGGLYMLLLAFLRFRDCAREDPFVEHLPRRGGDVAAGAAISLCNPLNVTYWLSVATIVYAITGEGGYVAFFASFMSASVLWAFVMAYIAALIGSYMPLRVVRIMFGLCGLAMAYIGLTSLFAGIEVLGGVA